MDDAIAGTQRHPAPVHNEIRQAVVHGHIHWLGISGGMAERLQHQIGGKTQTGQIFEFVTGHGPGGILRTHGGHVRFAVGIRTHTRHTTGLADHFLRQRKAFAAGGNFTRTFKYG